MSAWVEVIHRENMRRDVELGDMIRAAHHTDNKGWKAFTKKIRENGQ